MLDIQLSDNGEIRLVGRLDAAQAPKAQEFLDAVGETRTVDMKDLEYISSAGLGVLLKTQKRLAAGGGGLKLVNLNKHILDVFRYSGLDQIFEIQSSPEG